MEQISWQNQSLNYVIFPSNVHFFQQIAKLKPLFRKGSTTLPKNYCPISLLPLISKIIEKVIHDQTEAFWMNIRYFKDFNQDLGNIFLQTRAFQF